MSVGLTAMLAGVFGVPAVLLWMGHRLRRRSPRWQRTFWGALVAHVIAVPVAATAAMIPATEWAATDTVRGLLGFWLLLIAPMLGALIGWIAAGREVGSRLGS